MIANELAVAKSSLPEDFTITVDVLCILTMDLEKIKNLRAQWRVFQDKMLRSGYLLIESRDFDGRRWTARFVRTGEAS